MEATTSLSSPDTQILIVDDDIAVMRTLSMELCNIGYSCLTAQNGYDALLLLEKHYKNVGLVISDWIMPELDGLELLTNIRKNIKFKDVAFLMLTSKGYEEDIVRGLDAGANDFIKKPFKYSEFLARIKNLLKAYELQKELKEMAVKDCLTGLYNQRYFRECLQSEIERVRRYGGDLSLIMLDIDHFKQFNDRYGHQTGDFILRTLGQLTAALLRKVDTPCRCGGEEFIIILPSTAGAGAEILAERIRESVEQYHFDKDGDCFRVTCSLGVATYDKNGDTPQSFIDKVDMAMYASKNQGRNRVTVFHGLTPEALCAVN